MPVPAVFARGGEAWRAWVGIWKTPSTTLAWLRIFYATSLLFMWPQLDSRSLGGLPEDLWFAPLGPFLLAPGYPPVLVLTACEVLARAFLVLLAFGAGTRVASLGFAATATFLAGVRFSTGKIDHDILILTVVPVAMAFSSWGSRISVDALISGSRGRSHIDSGSAVPLSIVALATGLEFFTSGVIKALTGWLDPSGSAVRAWVFQYVFALNPNEISLRAVSMPAPVAWEALDMATVLFEVGFLVAIASRQWTRLYVAAACVFHIGILALMGIDFAKLAVVYLLLVARSGQDAAQVPTGTRTARPALLWGVVAAVGAVSIPAFWLGGGSLEILGRLGALGIGAPFTPALAVLISLAVYSLWRWRRGLSSSLTMRSVRVVAPLAALPLAAVGVLLTLFVSEPFPAVLGPLFWGDRSEGVNASIVVTRIEVQAGDHPPVSVGASELYGVREPYATNLLAAHFPAGGPDADLSTVDTQGHAFFPFSGGTQRGVLGVEVCRRFEDAVGVGEITVDWVRVEYLGTTPAGEREIGSYRFSTGRSCDAIQEASYRPGSP